MRQPIQPITPERFDALLAEGDRRTSAALYRHACPTCSACEPVRIPIDRFTPSHSQRRVWRRNAEVRAELGPPTVTERHLEIYNRHKNQRGLDPTGVEMTELRYRHYYVRSCVDTQEVRYLIGDRLVAVSLLDLGKGSASSMYHYFDPEESARSLGVYSVLKEIELLKGQGFSWYYLGQWVQGCRSLAYKAQYHPHQRLQGGAWREFSTTEG
jgi:arginine-tRNA-protein transferase